MNAYFTPLQNSIATISEKIHQLDIKNWIGRNVILLREIVQKNPQAFISAALAFTVLGTIGVYFKQVTILKNKINKLELDVELENSNCKRLISSEETLMKTNHLLNASNDHLRERIQRDKEAFQRLETQSEKQIKEIKTKTTTQKEQITSLTTAKAKLEYDLGVSVGFVTTLGEEVTVLKSLEKYKVLEIIPDSNLQECLKAAVNKYKAIERMNIAKTKSGRS